MKNPGGIFTLFLIFTAFMGSRLVQIGFGDYNITPYRLACAIGLLLIPFNRKTIKSNKLIYSYYVFLIFWILYSFFLLVIATPDKKGFLENLFFLLCGTITTYYIAVYVRDWKMMKKCFLTIEIAAIVPYIFAFYEIFVGTYLFVSSSNQDYYSLESADLSSLGLRVPISTFSNPNDFSFMIIVVLVASFLLYKISKTKKKYLHLFVVWVSLFLILAAQSRAGVISVFIFWGVYMLNRFSILSSSKKKLYLAMIPLLVGGIYWIYWVYQDIIEPLLLFGEHSDTIRENLIRSGWVYLKSSYYLGVGLGNIEYYVLNRPLFYTGEILNIHNWWMEILVSSGVIVFLWYVMLYLKLINRTYKGIKKVNGFEIKLLYISSFSYLIMFIIDSMSSSSLVRTECAWVIMAIMFLVPGFDIRINTQIDGEKRLMYPQVNDKLSR